MHDASLAAAWLAAKLRTLLSISSRMLVVRTWTVLAVAWVSALLFTYSYACFSRMIFKVHIDVNRNSQKHSEYMSLSLQGCMERVHVPLATVRTSGGSTKHLMLTEISQLRDQLVFDGVLV